VKNTHLKCRYIIESLNPSIMGEICPECSIQHDMDVNVAKNILTIGTTDLAFNKINNKLVY